MIEYRCIKGKVLNKDEAFRIAEHAVRNPAVTIERPVFDAESGEMTAFELLHTTPLPLDDAGILADKIRQEERIAIIRRS